MSLGEILFPMTWKLALFLSVIPVWWMWQGQVFTFSVWANFLLSQNFGSLWRRMWWLMDQCSSVFPKPVKTCSYVKWSQLQDLRTAGWELPARLMWQLGSRSLGRWHNPGHCSTLEPPVPHLPEFSILSISDVLLLTSFSRKEFTSCT